MQARMTNSAVLIPAAMKGLQRLQRLRGETRSGAAALDTTALAGSAPHAAGASADPPTENMSSTKGKR
jgi:hypothetical protein